MGKPIRGNGLSDFDGLEDRILKRLGSSALENKALGVGTTRRGTEAGKANAVYAEVDLTTVPDLLNVDVSHRLGAKPTLCELVEYNNASASVFAQARPVSKDKWTPTNCRMAVQLTGTQVGTVLKFRVGGI
ncbi:MAG TPA: hypothetical protein VJN72_14385 [Gaiellales bacterium]|nr:hypothetical protein [Gaiellales bacterium]